MAYASQIPTDLSNVSGAVNLVLDSRLSYETKEDPSYTYFNFLAIPEEYRLTNIGRIDLQSVSLTVPMNNLNNTNNSINVKIDVVGSKSWEALRSQGHSFTKPYIKRLNLTSRMCTASNFETGALADMSSQISEIFRQWCYMINNYSAPLNSNWIWYLANSVYLDAGDPATDAANIKIVYDSQEGKITLSSHPAMVASAIVIGDDAINIIYAPQIVMTFGMTDDTTSSEPGVNTIGQFNACRDFFGIDVKKGFSLTKNTIEIPLLQPGYDEPLTWDRVQLQSSTNLFVLNSSLAVGTSNNFYDSNHDAVGHSIDQATFFTIDIGDKAPGEIYTKDFDKNSNNTWFYPSGLNLRSTFRIQVSNVYGDVITDPGRGFLSINLKCYPM